jgi:hypothetical protein
LNGKTYFYNITNFDIGIHTYQFWAFDGTNTTSTAIFNKPIVYNTKPSINTTDNLTAIEDTYYEVQYNYDDIDVANVGQSVFWGYSSNASWLSFDNVTTILNGTPVQEDVGEYWVNISINDTMEVDFTNFTLTVLNVNDDPIMNTTNIETTGEDELYSVDYNATDIDSPIANQIWSLATNATAWLSIDTTTGIISGVPTNDDVGEYWVNVSVVDGDGGDDYETYTLIVLNVNDRPEITTTDVLMTNSNVLYSVDYNATDIDSPLSQLVWSLTTNATWLSIDAATGILSGTPTNAGWFNVNVTVDDGDDGQDWHEFVLTVIYSGGIINEPPVITTNDILYATVDLLYYVNYDATDDQTSVDLLTWKLLTNASWLTMDTGTGVISGTPLTNDAGSYWVNVSVTDEHHAVDFHNFTITVTEYPIVGNIIPKLLSPELTPPAGDIETVFTFSVHYYDADDESPTYIQLVIDGIQHDMMLATGDPSNGTYVYKTTLSTGIHTYYFSASDGIYLVRTDDFDTSIIKDIGENIAPELSNPELTVTEGDTELEFTFSIHYQDANGDQPEYVRVVIDGVEHDMELILGDPPADGDYEFKINLSKATHQYHFTASDGIETVKTNDLTKSYSGEEDGDDDGDGEEDNTWLFALIGIIIVVIVVLVLLFVFLKKKKGEEEPPVEEPQAPPPVEMPAEQMPHAQDQALAEQPPTAEVPPEPAPAPTPEMPPEQPSMPETPPEPEQAPTPEPASQPAQQPAPEQTPAPQPQPASVPQVKEQPVAEPPAEPQQPQVLKVKEPEE